MALAAALAESRADEIDRTDDAAVFVGCIDALRGNDAPRRSAKRIHAATVLAKELDAWLNAVEGDDAQPAVVSSSSQRRRLSIEDLSDRADDEQVRVVTVETNYVEALIMDSRDSLIAGLCGQRHGGRVYIFINSTKIGQISALLWTAACFVGFATCCGVFPPHVGWAVFALGLPSMLI